MQCASSVDSQLFVKHPLQGVLQGLLQAATGKVEDIEAALVSAADPAGLTHEIFAEWPFEIPVIDEAGIYTTHDCAFVRILPGEPRDGDG
jgi:hypothetical protein